MDKNDIYILSKDDKWKSMEDFWNQESKSKNKIKELFTKLEVYFPSHRMCDVW